MSWGRSGVNKYGNKKIEMNGKIYDSKLEAEDALELHQFVKDKKISELEEQVRFFIVVNGVEVGYSRVDFRFKFDGWVVWYETKGFPTDVYKLKRKCIEAMLKDSDTEVYIVNSKDLQLFMRGRLTKRNRLKLQTLEN